MTTKIYKLFGIKILEIQDLTPKEVEQIKLTKKKTNPKGEILTYTPEELEKENGDSKETI